MQEVALNALSLDQGECVGTALIDVSKLSTPLTTYYSLIKLPAYGILNDEYRWFSYYLSDRMQRVSVNGTYSEWPQSQ